MDILIIVIVTSLYFAVSLLWWLWEDDDLASMTRGTLRVPLTFKNLVRYLSWPCELARWFK